MHRHLKRQIIYLGFIVLSFALHLPCLRLQASEDLQHSPMVSAVAGERYEALVPDTLDLADRMGLAINALTNVWDPDARYGLKFNVDFSRRPAVQFVNHFTDVYLNIPPKFVEALALSRLASGNSKSMDVDLGVLRSQLSFIGDDGLTYCPTDIFDKVPMGLGEFEENPAGDVPAYSEIWGEGRQLVTLSILAQIDPDSRWIEIGKRKVDRLLSLTREKKLDDMVDIIFASRPPPAEGFKASDFSKTRYLQSSDARTRPFGDSFRYFWRAQFNPGLTPPSDADEPGLMKSEGGGLYSKDPFFTIIYSIGSTGHGAGLFYRVTGYEPALELSEGLAKWALARLFHNDDGSYTFWHYHHGLYALMAVCEYAVAAGDRKMLERVNTCYRFAREMGDPLIGYYPEAQPGSDWYLHRHGNTVEVCEVADMCWLALYLIRAGVDDYWDDIDRWVRNVYAEGQLCDPGLFDSIPDHYYETGPDHRLYKDTDKIKERSIGSFFGWMRANEALEVQRHTGETKLKDVSIMHCCTANGARTLYCIWDDMLQKQGDLVKVNLLLNRASPWLDVDSYLPVAGKVVLHVKDAPKVAVRIPQWCDPQAVDVRVGSRPVKAAVRGRYLHVYMLAPGDEVEFTFDVPERVEHRVLGEIPYTLTMRGANVVDIEPKGIAYPLYTQQPSGKRVKKMRFIPQIQTVIW